jgi:2-polyprenyl-3-methyl-5-hydroxy-6-metoxy-1,4-benzoquinol methylase
MLAEKVEGRARPPSAYYIRRVQTKFASGEYQTEEILCFCGSGEEKRKTVVDRDRYGFSHPMQLCLNCGLIYASPRMTAESYRKFYQNEYRKIYQDVSPPPDREFSEGVQSGTDLKGLLSLRDIHPETVFDIGCNSGGWLKPFQDSGAEVLGVDLDSEAIAYGRSMGLPIQVGGLDEIEQTGKKADLIILCHVLEHLLDLDSSLNRIRNLVSENGVVFVCVPNLFTWDLRALFQNAHVWQFTPETLTYVMECSGFDKASCDSYINSIWIKLPQGLIRQKRPTDYAGDIVDFIKGKKPALRLIPIIKGKNKFLVEDRKANVRQSFYSHVPDISVLQGKETGRDAIILCGGPSADDYVEKIRSLQQGGAVLISIERMYPWCLDHRLVPDYVVAMDASDDVVEAFDLVIPQPAYLVATQCHPSVLKALSRADVYRFNTPHTDFDESFYKQDDKSTDTEINSGASVSLCSLSISMLLGCRDFHIFGFDCHVSSGGYAKGIAGLGAQNDLITVRIGERDFKTTHPYLLFAQQFFQLMRFGKNDGLWNSVKVYGDSLVCAMSVENIRGD